MGVKLAKSSQKQQLFNSAVSQKGPCALSGAANNGGIAISLHLRQLLHNQGRKERDKRNDKKKQKRKIIKKKSKSSSC